MNQIKPHNAIIRYISGNGTVPWSYEATLTKPFTYAEAKEVLVRELGHKPDSVMVVSIISVKPAVEVAEK